MATTKHSTASSNIPQLIGFSACFLPTDRALLRNKKPNKKATAMIIPLVVGATCLNNVLSKSFQKSAKRANIINILC